MHLVFLLTRRIPARMSQLVHYRWDAGAGVPGAGVPGFGVGPWTGGFGPDRSPPAGGGFGVVGFVCATGFTPFQEFG